MATQNLTPRQQEIKALMEQGKKPKDIAKKLKISENAVYQQIRRIRSGGASGRSTSGAARKSGGSNSRSQARSGGRQSSGSRPARRAAAPRPAAVPQTAEALLKAEIVAGEQQIAERETEISAAQTSIEGLKAQNVATAEELERKRQTLAVLTGEMVAHAKPKPAARRSSSSSSRRSSGQKGSTNGSKAASGAQASSQAPSQSGGSTASGDGASAGSGEKEGAAATA
jgi:uncharacterized coiled-coil protein SlyX